MTESVPEEPSLSEAPRAAGAEHGRPRAALTGHVARGVAWTAFERWFVRLLNLVTFTVIARGLLPRELGLVALATTFVAIVTMLTEAGLGAYVVQTERLDKGVLDSTFWTSFGLSLAGAVGLAGSAPLWARIYHEPRLTLVLLVLSLSLVASGLSTVPVALLQRELRFRPLAVRQTVAALTAAVVAITLALAGAGVWALVAQSLATASVGVVVLWAASSWRPGLSFGRRHARASLRFGSRLLIVNVLKVTKDQGEYLAIGVILGSAALGYWTVATRVLNIVIELGVSVVTTVAVPAFAAVRADRERLIRGYSRATAASAVIVLPLLIILSAVSRDLLPLLFGGQWSASGRIATVLTYMALFAVLVNFDEAVYIASGRPGVELALVCGIVSLHLGTVLAFAHWGLMALAVALLVRSALTWPIRVLVLRQVVGVTWRAYSGVGLALLSGALAALAMQLARWTPLGDGGIRDIVGLCAVGGVVYVVASAMISKDFRSGARRGSALLQRRVPLRYRWSRDG